VPDARKLKHLEEENRKLKSVVAELTLDNRALKDVLFIIAGCPICNRTTQLSRKAEDAPRRT
jgi:hypothetical protein